MNDSIANACFYIHPPYALTFDHSTALLTTVADGNAIFYNSFKVPPFYLMNLKTFRTTVISKFIFRNDEMTMPAA